MKNKLNINDNYISAVLHFGHIENISEIKLAIDTYFRKLERGDING